MSRYFYTGRRFGLEDGEFEEDVSGEYQEAVDAVELPTDPAEVPVEEVPALTESSEITEAAETDAKLIDDDLETSNESLTTLENIYASMKSAMVARGGAALESATHEVAWAGASIHMRRLGVKVSTVSLEGYDAPKKRNLINNASLETIGESIKAGWNSVLSFIKSILAAIGRVWDKLFDSSLKMAKKAKEMREKLKDAKLTKANGAVQNTKIAYVFSNGGAATPKSTVDIINSWSEICKNTATTVDGLGSVIAAKAVAIADDAAAVEAAAEEKKEDAKEKAEEKADTTIEDVSKEVKGMFGKLGAVPAQSNGESGLHYHNIKNLGFGGAKIIIATGDALESNSYVKVIFEPGEQKDSTLGIAAMSRADIESTLDGVFKLGESIYASKAKAAATVKKVESAVNSAAKKTSKVQEGDALKVTQASRKLCMNGLAAISTFSKISFSRGVTVGETALSYVAASIKLYK